VERSSERSRPCVSTGEGARGQRPARRRLPARGAGGVPVADRPGGPPLPGRSRGQPPGRGAQPGPDADRDPGDHRPGLVPAPGAAAGRRPELARPLPEARPHARGLAGRGPGRGQAGGRDRRPPLRAGEGARGQREPPVDRARGGAEAPQPLRAVLGRPGRPDGAAGHPGAPPAVGPAALRVPGQHQVRDHRGQRAPAPGRLPHRRARRGGGQPHLSAGAVVPLSQGALLQDPLPAPGAGRPPGDRPVLDRPRGQAAQRLGAVLPQQAGGQGQGVRVPELLPARRHLRRPRPVQGLRLVR
jgi:hypothetical protein